MNLMQYKISGSNWPPMYVSILLNLEAGVADVIILLWHMQ